MSPNEYKFDIQSQQMLFNLRNKMLKLEGILIEDQEKQAQLAGDGTYPWELKIYSD